MGLGTYPKMSPQLHILTGSAPSYYLMSMLQGDVDVIIII